MKLLKVTAAIILLAALVGGMVLYARHIEPNRIFTNNVVVKTDTPVQPFKIVFFSDTHFGALYGQERIERIVQKINEEQADIVIFGGDFFDAYASDRRLLDVHYLSEQLAAVQAKYAKLAVWGNHDYGGGSVRIYQEMMESGGFELLKNRSTEVSELGVTVTGIDDYLLGKPDLSCVAISPEHLQIVVTHAPDMADDMDLERADLVVAGHSHGGQVSLPLLTKKVLPPGAEKYVKGRYKFENARGTQLLVSKGLGMTKLPYRFLNAPEINVIEVVTAQ